jgi:hypothetical protein
VDRIAFFGDAIFAITLLTLQLSIPNVWVAVAFRRPAEALLRRLRRRRPSDG